MRFWKRKKKEEKEPLVIINSREEKLPESSIKRIHAIAAGVAKKAMKISETVYPEDIFLLWLDEQKALRPEQAVHVPNDYLAAMYSLWAEGFVMNVGDEKVYITPSGRYVIKILKMKVAGDKKWKQYT